MSAAVIGYPFASRPFFCSVLHVWHVFASGGLDVCQHLRRFEIPALLSSNGLQIDLPTYESSQTRSHRQGQLRFFYGWRGKHTIRQDGLGFFCVCAECV